MLKELGKISLSVLEKILRCKYLLFIIFILVILVSYFRVNLNRISKYDGSEKEFNLTVINKKHKNNQYIVTLKEKEKIIIYIDEFPYDVGDIVLVKGTLEQISNNTIPNLFNYREYLQGRGIYWKLNIQEIELIKKNNSIWNSARSKISASIENSINREYLYAYLLGDTSYFSEEKRKIYDSTGLSYILSIGSLQVMMLTKFLEKIEMKWKKRKEQRLIINTLIIIFYMIFTNLIIGVLRSGSCYLLKKILDFHKIKVKYYNIILIIGIILLTINPFYIKEIGFLYSFSISLAISLLKKKIVGSFIRRLFVISAVAFIVGLPITIYSNFEVNFLTIFWGMIFVPIFNSLVFPLCIIVFIFPFLSFILNFIISLIENIITFLSQINIFTFVFRKPGMFLIILYYFVIGLFFWKKKYCIVLIGLLIIHNNINRIIKEDLLTFLDVQQGDAIVLKSNNRLFLIDTGGSYNYEYSTQIVKYIKSLGISRIDKMFLTHGDMDHLGSSYQLVNKIKVNNIYFNNNEYNNNEKQLIELLKKKRINYQKISNFSFKINNFTIRIKSYNLNLENDSSMIFSIEYPKFKLLLMGDATTKTENKLMSEINLSKYQVLKLGHHGSKTSTSEAFYKKVKPDISIISVGANNIYHLPNYSILKRVKDSKVYLTSKNGSIMLRFHNNDVYMKEYRPFD